MADEVDVEAALSDQTKEETPRSTEEIELKTATQNETNEQDTAVKPKSRFKVNRVGFAEKPKPESVDTRTGSEHEQHTGDGDVTAEPSSPAPHSPRMSESDHNSLSYDTHNMKTFGRGTIEALPHVDHYRDLLSTTAAMQARPTLQELHEAHAEKSGEKKDAPKETNNEDALLKQVENGNVQAKQTEVKVKTKKDIQAPKFGWIKGVLVRCLLNIWGVMLFLRLSWVVGQAGIGLTSVVILLASVVTVITALSMSAICTNGEVKGGGAYYMISRSLGPEFGGPIGLIFSLANAVAVAMYVVGFAETVRDLLKEHDALMVDESNDVRIIGVITVILVLGISIAGMEWEAKAQLVLLGILLIAMLNFVVGTCIPPTDEKMSKGMTGYSTQTFVDNFGPDFRDGEDFFSVFAIFFPAATGILAGANISGDLADAQKAIPKGTLLAILISGLTYLAMGWLVGAVHVRDATGNIMDALVDPKNFTNCTPPGECKYGLLHDFQVMELVSGFGPLITAGIFSATLSSALASMVGAPKVFQAVCKDKIFPKIQVFAKGYGKAGEPWRAYILTFVIALGFILIGELNAIAPIISNFFLMSYALINYSCFDASLAKSPGWRPAFRYYSQWASLAGALLCLAVMFVINWWAALITFVIICSLYVYVHYSKPEVNWGSSTQAHIYKNALQQSLKLISVEEHVKNYRPQFLVLTGLPNSRPSLVDFCSNITKNISLMVCGHVLQTESNRVLPRLLKTSLVYKWLQKRKVKSFYTYVTSSTLRDGARALFESVGMGKLRPNTLLIGYKSNWQTDEPKKMDEYFNIVHDAFDFHFGVGILRVKEGFDFSESLLAEPVFEEDFSSLSVAEPEDEPEPEPNTDLLEGHASTDSEEDSAEEDEPVEEENIEKGKPEGVNREVLQYVNRFQRKQKKGFIDVWWLYDDGGLTLLIPYILSNKSHWSHCDLRVFTPGTKKQELDRDHKNMATLLSKFRIDYSKMTIVHDIQKRPCEESISEFKSLTKDWMLEEGETAETHPWKISEAEYLANKEKTYRHLRLKELLMEHSSQDTSLIVMTLPMPRKGTCPSGLYMSWIETLTKDMPCPMLLLRGNQTSVLTYYS